MRLWVQSLVSFSGLRIRHCCELCVGSDLALLPLLHRPAAVAPIRPLAREMPYDTGVTLKKQKQKKKQKKKKKKKKRQKEKPRSQEQEFRKRDGVADTFFHVGVLKIVLMALNFLQLYGLRFWVLLTIKENNDSNDPKWCWDNLIAKCEIMNLNPYCTQNKKISSKWINDLKVRGITYYKILKENISIKSSQSQIWQWFLKHGKRSKNIKRKNSELNFIKVKNFCASKVFKGLHQ